MDDETLEILRLVAAGARHPATRGKRHPGDDLRAWIVFRRISADWRQ